MIDVLCPNCQQKIPVVDNVPGRRFTCPACNKQLAMPGSEHVQQPSPTRNAAYVAPSEDIEDDLGLPQRPLPRRRLRLEGPPPSNGFAVTGMVLGIVAILTWWSCFGFIGVPCAVLAIIFSSLGLSAKQSHGMAVAGLVLGISSLVLCFGFWFVAFSFLSGFNPWRLW
jgi:hypothetical protein